MADWHALTKMLRAYYEAHMQEEAVIKAINMKFLQIFYLASYVEDDFYEAFQYRMDEMKQFLGTIGIV